VFCGFMKRNCQLQLSKTSGMSMDDIRQMLKASEVDMQSLKRLVVLVTVKELVCLVCVRRLLTRCVMHFNTVHGNQLIVPHMNFAYLRTQW
jgi:hypothetical protein